MMNKVSEQYELKKCLGEGSYGAVYHALRQRDGKEVALKMLLEPLVPDFRRRFEREVKLLHEYQHPGVMRVLDANLDAAQPYYVMPLYRNGTLQEQIGKLAPEEFLNIFEGLVEVLTHLEARGAFHRDIKPLNILIDDDGKPVLCDFGMGNDPALTDHFTRGECGTTGYMAPELSRFRNGATPQCDVYSLGATAFELLTGTHPGDAKDFRQHLEPFPAEIRDQILAMLDPEPSRRPKARDLWKWLKETPRAKLSALLEQAKNAVAPESSLPPWLWPLLGVIGGLTILAGVGYGLWRLCQPESDSQGSQDPSPIQQE
jgi:serine/threonine protein kinase